MECCAQQGTNRFFSRWSKNYCKRFLKKGLAKEQRLLIEGIRQESVTSKTVLDIGSGVGALHLSLLQHGAVSAVGVDIAEGMIEKARQLAREMGLTERTRYIVGDFVELNGEVPPSDITLLDKVVCCYENVYNLVEHSTAKTKAVYALTFPRDYLPVRVLFRTQIFIAQLFRFSFRPYWHDWPKVCRAIETKNFEETYRNKTLLWEARVYRKLHVERTA